MRFLLTLTAVFTFINSQSQIYTAKTGSTTITFHSDAPLENIDATNKGAIIVFKSSTAELQVRVTIQNFQFNNSLMKEHFNENYMETDLKVEVNGAATYPNRYAEFKGKINEPLGAIKEGETKVSLTGKMAMHGVTRDITIEGTLTKKGEEIFIASKFRIKVADYNIKVPSMYVKSIAEEVDVTISSVLEPLQKK